MGHPVYQTLPHTDLTHTFSGLSAGTIIYVVVFEVLQRERSKPIRPKIVQFLALVVGFATMMTVDLLGKCCIIRFPVNSF